MKEVSREDPPRRPGQGRQARLRRRPGHRSVRVRRRARRPGPRRDHRRGSHPLGVIFIHSPPVPRAGADGGHDVRRADLSPPSGSRGWSSVTSTSSTGFLVSVSSPGTGSTSASSTWPASWRSDAEGRIPNRNRSQSHLATWVGTPTAALAAAAALRKPAVTQFHGFKHFAFIGTSGMLLCWTATYFLAPAVLILQDRRWPIHGTGVTGRNWFQRWRQKTSAYERPFVFLVSRAPRPAPWRSSPWSSPRPARWRSGCGSGRIPSTTTCGTCRTIPRRRQGAVPGRRAGRRRAGEQHRERHGGAGQQPGRGSRAQEGARGLPGRGAPGSSSCSRVSTRSRTSCRRTRRKRPLLEDVRRRSSRLAARAESPIRTGRR